MLVKKLMIASLVAAQVGGAAAPAAAADLVRDRAPHGSRAGAFAGVRLRLSLDAEPRERVSAALALSPTTRNLRGDGSSDLMIGHGLEFGLSERRSPRVSLAGRPLAELGESGRAREGQRQNVSTAGWLAIGVGVAAVAFAAWFFHEMGDCDEHDDEC